MWFIESGGAQHYAEVKYSANDYLIFGRETAGLPKSLLEANPDQWLRIPMFNAEARSLNLSNCAALVLYEALRQQGFGGVALDG
jgi:tRNA (cytidine/uridine-2'-O-)-methyltransferase